MQRMNAQKLEYQRVLLSLGQFEGAVDDFLGWLALTDSQLESLGAAGRALPASGPHVDGNRDDRPIQPTCAGHQSARVALDAQAAKLSVRFAPHSQKSVAY